MSEYSKDGRSVFVQYSKTSGLAIRLQVIYSPGVERSKILSSLSLPGAPDTRKTDKKGATEEYFGNPYYIVLTFEHNSSTHVAQVGYFSRDLFDTVTPELAKKTVSGRWTGSWSNIKGESGTTTVEIAESGHGALVGDEGGWEIKNGFRSGRILTWEYRGENNGCRDYKVKWEILPDGATANGTYSMTDRCTKETYTGTYVNYRRASQ